MKTNELETAQRIVTLEKRVRPALRNFPKCEHQELCREMRFKFFMPVT